MTPQPTPKPTLSVVAPCFNEADGLHAFHERVSAACAAALGADGSWEIVLINDGGHISRLI